MGTFLTIFMLLVVAPTFSLNHISSLYIILYGVHPYLLGTGQENTGHIIFNEFLFHAPFIYGEHLIFLFFEYRCQLGIDNWIGLVVNTSH